MLTSKGLAPATQATLDELTNPQLRPQHPADPFPDGLEAFAPAQQVELDKDTFATVLRQTRRGLSGGMWGGRYEYFKPCLEDEVAFDALYEVAQRLAKAEIPNTIRDGLLFSSLTALLKPNTRVRASPVGMRSGGW